MNTLLSPLVASVSWPAAGGPAMDVVTLLAPAGVVLAGIVGMGVALFVSSRRPRIGGTPILWTPRRVVSPIVRAVAALVLAMLAADTAHAQGVADNLQCHRLTDAARKRLKAVVDLDAPSAGLAPGCRLSRAKLYCTPTKARVQPGTLFDGSQPLAELPYHGRPAETDRICYEVTCPAAPTVTETVTDRFGTRDIKRSTTEMLCTPAVGGTLPPPAEGFQLTSPRVDIQPHQNISYCYYFRTPNTATVPVRKFVSALGPAVKSVVMWTTTDTEGRSVDRLPAGTLSAADCNMLSLSDALIPRWIYASDPESTEMTLPADDGAGHPLAMEIPPNSAGFLMIHHDNTSDQVVSTNVRVNAEGLGSPIYTPTDTFTTYSSDIAIPPQTFGHIVSRSCLVPSGARFWRWSMRTHKRATQAMVVDLHTSLYESLDWEHPGASLWPTPPFQSFGSPRVTYLCSYDNATNRTIRTGPSQQTDEQCMAVGYFFPATGPVACIDGFIE